MNTQQIKIFNGKILTPYRIISGGSILISGDTITTVSQGNIEAPGALEIDAQGHYISPGFIDIHIHGGGGADFMDESVDAFLEVARTHARYGTTAITPTLLTSDNGSLIRTLDLYEEANKKNTNAQFIGMHLEGPYLAVKQCGAQDPAYIRDPDRLEYQDILSRYDFIKRWSAAPELQGAIKFGQYIRTRGILPAIAHSDAIYEEVMDAFENGYTLATHLYSGMSGVTRRNSFRFAGVIESALLIDEMNVEIIADGKHLPASLLKLVYKIKGADRIALITDSMRGAAMPEGDSTLGNKHRGLKVIIEDGVAKLPDRTAFAGSVATTDRLVRNMITMADVSLIDAVRMMTSTPATIMGMAHKKGSLAAGKDADIVIFDSDINIQTTIVKGRVVHSTDKRFIDLPTM